MPAVSEAERRAMYAAKSGHSTLGIPQSVGAEFVAADPGGKLPARAPKRHSAVADRLRKMRPGGDDGDHEYR